MKKTTIYAMFLFFNAICWLLVSFYLKGSSNENHELKVSEIGPIGEVEVKNFKQLVIEFKTPLDLNSVDNESIQFFPKVEGVVEMKNQSTLCFSPVKPLQSASVFRIRLNKKLRGYRGEKFNVDEWEVKTKRPQIESVTQKYINVGGDSSLDLEFNQAIDPKILKAYLSLKYKNSDEVHYRISNRFAAKRIHISFPRLRYDEVFLIIKKELTSTAGPRTMDFEYKQSIHFNTKLKFYGLKTQYKKNKSFVHFKFNTAIDSSEISNYVEIQPKLEAQYESAHNGFKIKADFEPGQRYTFKLKAGLSGGDSGLLSSEIVRSTWVPDRPESLKIELKNGYLSPEGPLLLPLEVVNIKEVELKVKQLHTHNLIEYAARGRSYLHTDLSVSKKTKKLTFDLNKNKIQKHKLDLKALLGNEQKGVYEIEVKKKNDWQSDDALVVITDLGLSLRMGISKATVWVNSISSALPLEGVVVQLYSSKRVLLGEGRTEKNGLCSFDVLKGSELGEMSFLIAKKDNDLCYLNLKKNIVQTDRKNLVGRRYLSSGYELYAFTERGLYRPGDSIQLSAIIRAANIVTPPVLPIEVTVFQPNGKLFSKTQELSNEQGCMKMKINLPHSAASGSYKVVFKAPGSSQFLKWGECNFNVADYMPQTLKMELSAEEKAYHKTESIYLKAQVKHRFGDSAKGLAVKGRVRYSSENFYSKTWKAYQFTNFNQYGAPKKVELRQQKCDQNGIVDYKIKSYNLHTPGRIRSDIEIEVNEVGGRALNESTVRYFYPFDTYLGCKISDQNFQINKEIKFNTILIKPSQDLQKNKYKLTFSIEKINRQRVMKIVDEGRIRYQWQEKKKMVLNRETSIESGKIEFRHQFKESGSYRVMIKAPGASPYERNIYVSGEGAKWHLDSPESLSCQTNRSKYNIGDKVKLTIQSPFDGKVWVAVESDRVIENHFCEIVKGEGILTLEAKESWKTNVYLHTQVIRPAKAEKEWMPHRASKSIALRLDSSENKLTLECEHAKNADPDSEQVFKIKVSDQGVGMANTVLYFMAVDEGVLALDDYRTPDPFGYFYAKRRLSVSSYDLYSRLTPQLSTWQYYKALKPGGGGRKRGAMSRQFSPVTAKRVDTAVLYRGLIKTDQNGVALIKKKMPLFIGEMRVMCIAVNGKKFASKSGSLLVRSELMLKSSWPRFMTPGDNCEATFTVFNKSKSSGNVELDFNIDGPVRLMDAQSQFFLAAGKEKTVRLVFNAYASGKCVAHTVVRMNGLKFKERLEIAVRAPSTFDRESKHYTLKKGEILEFNIGEGYHKSSSKATLCISGRPELELSRSVESLLKYPYGCLEQTSSRMIPLLYLSELLNISRPEMDSRAEIQMLLERGFERYLMMQTWEGGLSMWPYGGSTYVYGSIYATDIMLEAKKAGFEVPEHLLASTIRYCKKKLNEWSRNKAQKNSKLGEACYAAYVLARAGDAPYQSIIQLEEQINDLEEKQMSYPQSAKFYLAGALFACGQEKGALALIGNNEGLLKTKRSRGGYLSSGIRQSAILLSVLSDYQSKDVRMHKLANKLKLYIKKQSYLNTQENAWSLVALGKIAKAYEGKADALIEVTLPSGNTESFKANKGWQKTFTGNPGRCKLKIQSEGMVYVHYAKEGLPLKTKETVKVDSGIKIRRRFYEIGSKIEVSAMKLEQGKLYRTRLELSANENIDNIVVVDRLVAGLEIENTLLRGSAGLGTHEEGNCEVINIERKDDRLLLFTKAKRGTVYFEYTVRAVTRGAFILPACEASCMYDGDIFSTHGFAKAVIK